MMHTFMPGLSFVDLCGQGVRERLSVPAARVPVGNEERRG
jgi:hypothetical protein